MRRRVVILSLGLALAVFVIWLFPKSNAPVAPIVLLPFPYKAPSRLSTRIEGCIPTSWSWFWRIRDKFRGPEIKIDAQFVQVDDAHLRKADVIGQDGTRIWKMGADEIDLFRSKADPETTMAMVVSFATRDGIEGLLSGTSAVRGSALAYRPSNYFTFKTRFYPTVRDGHLDVFAEVCANETMPNGSFARTNLMTAARLQFLNGCEYVIVSPTHGMEKPYATFVRAAFSKPKQKVKNAANSK